MKNILANKTSLLYNLGLLILLFTYPVANLTKASTEENNTKLVEEPLPNNLRNEKKSSQKFNMNDSIKMISNNTFFLLKFK